LKESFHFYSEKCKSFVFCYRVSPAFSFELPPTYKWNKNRPLGTNSVLEIEVNVLKDVNIVCNELNIFFLKNILLHSITQGRFAFISTYIIYI